VAPASSIAKPRGGRGPGLDAIPRFVRNGYRHNQSSIQLKAYRVSRDTRGDWYAERRKSGIAFCFPAKDDKIGVVALSCKSVIFAALGGREPF
jgi:hypothetical protein